MTGPPLIPPCSLIVVYMTTKIMYRSERESPRYSVTTRLPYNKGWLCHRGLTMHGALYNDFTSISAH